MRERTERELLEIAFGGEEVDMVQGIKDGSKAYQKYKETMKRLSREEKKK